MVTPGELVNVLMLLLELNLIDMESYQNFLDLAINHTTKE